MRILLLHLFFLVLFSCLAQISTPEEVWEDISKEELISAGYTIDSLTAAWNYIKNETPITGIIAINL